MDNLQVHKTAEVRALMEQYNIEPIFSPAYSPYYNPIEYIFSKLKGMVRKMRLQDMVKGQKREFDILVPLAM